MSEIKIVKVKRTDDLNRIKAEKLGYNFQRMVHAGMTAEEIAKVLDLDESTVRSAIIRLHTLEFD